MVYCSKCGKKNDDDAEYCNNCGVSLYITKKDLKKEETCFGQPERRVEDECSRIPYIGAIAGIIFGAFIILFGLSIAFNIKIWNWIGPFILIAVGILIIIVVLVKWQRT